MNEARNQGPMWVLARQIARHHSARISGVLDEFVLEQKPDKDSESALVRAISAVALKFQEYPGIVQHYQFTNPELGTYVLGFNITGHPLVLAMPFARTTDYTEGQARQEEAQLYQPYAAIYPLTPRHPSIFRCFAHTEEVRTWHRHQPLYQKVAGCH